ncbi:MAG: GNAT family N-acetyltransferase [Thermoplasmatota archaeon]
MNIIHYDQVDDNEMSELTLTCFSHPYSKKHIEGMIKADSRVPEWGGELYAEKNGRLLGTVGILFPRAKKVDGSIEKVGGIRNVCSRPTASRKGVAKTLLVEAHKKLKKEEVRFSFLMTSKATVAHNLYKKLGYRDIFVYPEAFKKVEHKKSEVEFKKEEDPNYIRELYMKSMKDLNGLVVR